jgi:hypothetical protein
MAIPKLMPDHAIALYTEMIKERDNNSVVSILEPAHVGGDGSTQEQRRHALPSASTPAAQKRGGENYKSRRK